MEKFEELFGKKLVGIGWGYLPGKGWSKLGEHGSWTPETLLPLEGWTRYLGGTGGSLLLRSPTCSNQMPTNIFQG